MNGGFLGQLGAFYDLDPGTLGSLASKSGMPIDPSWTGGAPAAPAPAPTTFDPSVAHSAPPPSTSPMNMPMPAIAPAEGAALAQSMAAQASLPPAGPPAPPQTSPEPQAATAQFIPGHMQQSTQEFGREGGMNPELAGEYAQHRYAQTGEDIAKIKAEQRNASIYAQAADVVGLDEYVRDQKHQREMQRQQREADRIKYVADNTAKVEAAVTEAQAKVNPDQIWEGNTFGRVLAAIAVGLGQFGASLTKTENGAARIIDSAIRNSIDAQKTNQANARQRIGDLRNARIDHLQSIDDEDQRSMANHLLLIEDAKQMTLNWAKNMGYDAAAPNVHALMGQLEGMRADVIKDVATNAGGKWHEKETLKYKEAQQIGGGASPAKREGNLVTTADGTTYKFDSEKSAEEGRAKLQSFGDVQLLTNEILRIRKETMKLDPLVNRQEFESNKLKLRTLDDQLAVADSKANGQGTVTEADAKRRKEVGLDATAGLDGMFGGAFKGIHRIVGTEYDAANAAYEQALKTNTDRQKGYIQAASPSVYNRDYARDKDGNLVPTGSYTGQDAKPAERLLPQGKALDGKSHPNTASRPDSELIPKAPIQKGTYRAAPAPAHGKKK